MEEQIVGQLPIQIIQDTITVDDSFLVITKEKSFLSRHLKKYYLSISSVYPKVIYKTYWVEEKLPGPLAEANMKIKATVIFPDVIGIEYAKSKTIYSKNHPRFIEVISGKGLVIVQKDTASLLDEATAYVIPLEAGKKSIIPPNWHYTIVNTGNTTLATVELYQHLQPLHQVSAHKKGSGVYVIERNGFPEIVKNSQYKNLAKYVTVDAESYVTACDICTTQHLLTQAGVLHTHIEDLRHRNWDSLLDTTDPRVIIF